MAKSTNQLPPAEWVPISKVIPNAENPRIIKDHKFRQLVKSIQDAPWMLELRPIVVNQDWTVIGGNQRLAACKAAGLKQIPVIHAGSLTPEQEKEFTVKDNVSYGEWEWDTLTKDWQIDTLTEWGLEAPNGTPIEYPAPHENPEVEQEFQRFNDGNCKYPIIPKLHEKHAFFLIAVDNEIDEAWIRNKFEINTPIPVEGKTDSRLSNFIPFEKLQDACRQS